MLMEANRSKKNTIQQVAEAAGVSIATASRAINQPESVKESTRLKVISAARKLNYRSTPKASRNILVIISSLWNPFHTEMINGIEEAAKKRGYFVYINQSGMWTALAACYRIFYATISAGEVPCSVLLSGEAFRNRCPICDRRRLRGDSP